MALKSFFSSPKKTSVGVVINAQSVSLICLAYHERKNKYELLAYGFFERQNRKAIKKAFEHPLIRSASLRLGVDESSVKTFLVHLPKVPDNEFANVLQWGLKSLTSDNLQDFEIRAY